MKTIIETVKADPEFTMLASIIKFDGLSLTLQGDGPFTLFAPSNEAFAKITTENLKKLVADKEKLNSVLNYHVVTGLLLSNALGPLKKVQTLQGGDLRVRAEHGVTINDANIVAADIPCINGVIHTIDTVLMP